jgi:hypothetical protein
LPRHDRPRRYRFGNVDCRLTSAEIVVSFIRQHNKGASMFQIKTFSTRKAMEAWLEKREGRIQYTEVFVNNAYAVEWRSLRWIG